MSTARFPLPVIEVWATPTRRAIIEYLVRQAVADRKKGRERQYHTLHDIMEDTDTSRESLRTELSADNQMLLLHETGMVTVRDPDANIRHYQLASTPPADLLVEQPDVLPVLMDICSHTASQKLVSFFLDDSDPDEYYSAYALHEQTGIGYETLDTHLPTLVTHGLIETREGSRVTEYSLIEGPLAGFIWELNDRLAQEFQS